MDKDYDEALHVFHTALVISEARVTPLKAGLTIRHSEMSGLVLCCRLQNLVTRLHSTGISSVSTLGDSTCVILALEDNSTSFTPFMHV